MSASVFVTSAAFAFILFSSCKKELAGTQSLQTGPEQKKSAKKQAIEVGSYYGGGIVFSTKPVSTG